MSPHMAAVCALLLSPCCNLLQIISARVGGVTQGDVRIAATAGCPVFAFNSPIDSAARTAAQRTGTLVTTEPTVQGLLNAVAQHHEQETERQMVSRQCLPNNSALLQQRKAQL